MASALARASWAAQLQGLLAVFEVVAEVERQAAELVGAGGDAGIDHSAHTLQVIHLNPHGIGGPVGDDPRGFRFLAGPGGGVGIDRVRDRPTVRTFSSGIPCAFISLMTRCMI